MNPVQQTGFQVIKLLEMNFDKFLKPIIFFLLNKLFFMAHKKGAGSTKNGRDSKAKRLGVKCFSGHKVKAGNIIVRQRGLSFKPGAYIGVGKDYTLYALKEGTVFFRKQNKKLLITII